MTYIHHFTFPLLLRQYHYENIVKILWKLAEFRHLQ
jgi:hypothetical protein